MEPDSPLDRALGQIIFAQPGLSDGVGALDSRWGTISAHNLLTFAHNSESEPNLGVVLMPPDKDRVVVSCAKGLNAHRMAAGIGDVVWSEAELLKVTRDGSVLRAKVGGIDVVAKVMQCSTFKRRLQALFRTTPGSRTFRAAQRLMDAKIRTAEPLLLVRGKCEGRLVECLLTRSVPGHTLLELIASNEMSAKDEHRVARAVGKQVKQITEAKLFNRDHKPSNLVVTGPGVQPAVVDTVAILKSPSRMRALRRMLTALAIEPTGLGRPPRRSLAMRTIRSAVQTRPEARRLYLEVAQEIASRKDIRPRHNPLVASAAS